MKINLNLLDELTCNNCPFHFTEELRGHGEGGTAHRCTLGYIDVWDSLNFNPNMYYVKCKLINGQEVNIK